MIEAIGSALTTVLGWIGQVVTAFVGSEGALNPLLPLLAIGIGISVVMLGIKIVRSFTWGA